jgi:Type I phosphodiesterase / nucleotide pyrophosphatase
MWDRAVLQVAALPLIGHLPGMFPGIHQREERIRVFSRQSARAIEIVADPAIGLALIHLQIPHPPAIYNRSRGMTTAKGRIGYLDNVALVDRTLGVLRDAIEQAGLWDRTALLVSADHGWRTSLWRGTPEWTADEEVVSRQDTSGVPFLLKLPHQTLNVSYDKRFNTVVTRKIITAVLSGRLSRHDSAVARREQRGFFPLIPLS